MRFLACWALAALSVLPNAAQSQALTRHDLRAMVKASITRLHKLTSEPLTVVDVESFQRAARNAGVEPLDTSDVRDLFAWTVRIVRFSDLYDSTTRTWRTEQAVTVVRLISVAPWPKNGKMMVKLETAYRVSDPKWPIDGDTFGFFFVRGENGWSMEGTYMTGA